MVGKYPRFSFDEGKSWKYESVLDYEHGDICIPMRTTSKVEVSQFYCLMIS